MEIACVRNASALSPQTPNSVMSCGVEDSRPVLGFWADQTATRLRRVLHRGNDRRGACPVRQRTCLAPQPCSKSNAKPAYSNGAFAVSQEMSEYKCFMCSWMTETPAQIRFPTIERQGSA